MNNFLLKTALILTALSAQGFSTSSSDEASLPQTSRGKEYVLPEVEGQQENIDDNDQENAPSTPKLRTENTPDARSPLTPSKMTPKTQNRYYKGLKEERSAIQKRLDMEAVAGPSTPSGKITMAKKFKNSPDKDEAANSTMEAKLQRILDGEKAGQVHPLKYAFVKRLGLAEGPQYYSLKIDKGDRIVFTQENGGIHVAYIGNYHQG